MTSVSDKFGGSRLVERMHAASGCGCDEELGDVQGFGWYGLMRFRRASAIVKEDNDGFVDAIVLGHDDADKRWASIVDDYNEFEDSVE